MFDGWIDIIPICVTLKAILVDCFKLFSLQTLEKTDNPEFFKNYSHNIGGILVVKAADQNQMTD